MNYNYIKSYFITFTIVFILLIQITLSANSIKILESNEDLRVIVKFTNNSIIENWNSIKNQLINKMDLNKNNNYSFLNDFINFEKINISNFHNEILSKIKSVINENISVKNIFKYTFNGFVIENISLSSIQKLLELPQIQSISIDKQIITFENIQTNSSNNVNINVNDFNNDYNSDTNVTIAFFDTGVDYNHPALKNQYLGGYDFVNNDNDPYDDNGHGTHCTGIAIGNHIIDGEITFQGIAPNYKYYSYKVMDENGTGYTSWFIEAFEKAIDPNNDGNISDKTDIISISAGDQYGTINDDLSNAASNAVNAGIIVLAAAGNKGPNQNTIASPACSPNVIAVGSVDKNLVISDFSSRGSEKLRKIKPDFLASGEQIFSTWPNNSYKVLSGTSMATPYIAGYCALILNDNKFLSPIDVSMILRQNAIDIGYNYTTQGYGYISTNIDKMVDKNVPISIINTSINDYENIITIKGSSYSQDFQYYKLSYQLNSNMDYWIPISISNNQINNNLLYKWDVSKIPSGYYKIKLETASDQYISTDISYVNIQNDELKDKYFIAAPKVIESDDQINLCLISNNNTVLNGIHLFLTPLNLPQIRMGKHVTFKQPKFRLESDQMKGLIVSMPINKDYFSVKTKMITIQNNLN
jgi:hypothetical protein